MPTSLPTVTVSWPCVRRGLQAALALCTRSLLLGLLAGGAIGLLDLLDDTDSNSLTHVTDSEASEWCVGLEGLDAHWLGWDQLGHAGIVLLHKLWVVLSLLGGTAVQFLVDVLELACNVRGVAIKHWGVAVGDLARVLHHNDLGIEGCALHRWVVLGVTAHVATTDLLDGNVLDVEASLNTADWDSSDSADLVNILERKTESPCTL